MRRGGSQLGFMLAPATVFLLPPASALPARFKSPASMPAVLPILTDKTPIPSQGGVDTPTKDERLPALRIARKLGLSHSTMQVYLRKPGAPLPDYKRHYSLEAVKSFVERNASWALVGANAQEMRERKLEIEISSKQFELELRKGQFIAKEDVGRTLIPLVQEIDDLIRQEYELVLPTKYIGKNAIECAQLNAAARDRIAKRFKTGALAAVETLVDSAKKASE